MPSPDPWGANRMRHRNTIFSVCSADPSKQFDDKASPARTMRKRHLFHTLVFGLPADFDFTTVRTVEQACRMLAALPNGDRGDAALGIWKARAVVRDKVAFRALIEAWDHDHREVAQAFGGEAEFAEALRAVAPPLKLPPGRPRREAKLGGVFLFRGVLVPPNHEAANHGYGIAWTFERDIAAWFAMRHWGSRGGD